MKLRSDRDFVRNKWSFKLSCSQQPWTCHCCLKGKNSSLRAASPQGQAELGTWKGFHGHQWVWRTKNTALITSKGWGFFTQKISFASGVETGNIFYYFLPGLLLWFPVSRIVGWSSLDALPIWKCFIAALHWGFSCQKLSQPWELQTEHFMNQQNSNLLLFLWAVKGERTNPAGVGISISSDPIHLFLQHLQDVF